VRFNCFLYNNIIVPAGSRCCPGHVNDHAFTDQAIHMMSNCRPKTDFNRTEIVDMFNKVRETLLNNKERGSECLNKIFSDRRNGTTYGILRYTEQC
jgi:hypothetical protein